MTPVYQASATLLVNQTQTPGTIAYNDILTSERLTKTYRELISKRPVLEQVIEELDLGMSADELASIINVEAVRDTQLLRLSVEHSDPEQARLLVNATAAAFIETNERDGLTRPGSVSTVEPAVTPSSSIRPRTTLNSLMGVLIGLLLAGALVLVFEYLDDTIKTTEDVEAAVGLPTLGGVARFSRRRTDTDALVVASPQRTAAAEGYRVLRTNVRFSTIDDPAQALLISSTSPGEGKSTTVANLAVAMAQTGQRVIVVDSDLRRPTLHRIFGLSNGAGLTNALLSREPDLSRFLQPTRFETLWVMTAGPLPPNPSELLGSRRLDAVISALRKEVDVLIFDSPPALAVADASILAAKVDGTMLVIDAGRTRVQALQGAHEALSRAKTRVLGAILNKLPERGRGYYYYPDYYSASDNGRNGHRTRRLPWDRKSQKPEESKSFA
jgi:capsular exopolysaccharide synthesis family protein